MHLRDLNSLIEQLGVTNFSNAVARELREYTVDTKMVSPLLSQVFNEFNYTMISAKETKLIKQMIAKNKNTYHIVYKSVHELDAMLPKESQSRRRYRPRLNCILYNSPEVSLAVALYKNLLIQTGNHTVISEFDWDFIFFDDVLVKKISDTAFRCREHFSPNWRYFVHINRLKDYVLDMSFDELYKVTVDWFTPKEHTYNGSTALFEQHYRDAIKKVLRQTPDRHIDATLTIKQFCQNPVLWGADGSVFTRNRADVIFDGNKVARTKWSWAWATSANVVERILTTPDFQRAKVFIKREPAKPRAVVGSDINTYLKMKYLSLAALDNLFRGDPRSPIWMGVNKKTKMWEDLMVFKGYRMPVDQSSFDQQQTLNTVLITIEELANYCDQVIVGEAKEDVMFMFDIVLKALSGGEVLVDKDGIKKTVQIRNGVLSGWYWTALIDTLINLATAEVVKLWVLEKGLPYNLHHLFAQGDDDDYEFSDKISAISTWLGYVSMGYQVNPSKFYISINSDEFLRKAISPDKITGYPARSILSILWRNPVGDPDAVGRARLDSILTRWKLFFDRCNSHIILNILYHDMVGAVKIKRQDIIDWVHTPRSFGGGGVPMVGNRWVDISDSYKETSGTLDYASVPAVVEQDKMYGHKKEWYNFLISTLNLKKGNFTKVEVKTIPIEFATGYNFVGESIFIQRRWKPGYFETVFSIIKDEEYLKEGLYDYEYYSNWLSGFSKSMQDYLLYDKVKIPPTVVEGFSIEYISAKFNDYIGRLLQKLRNSGGSKNLFRRLLLYSETRLFAFLQNAAKLKNIAE